MFNLKRSVMALALASAPALALSAEGVDLPNTLGMTAYGTSSAGYAQMVSIGNLLQNEYGVSLRILPGENDVSRMTPLKTDRVPVCACGIAAYYGAEGVLMFAGENWGPQPIRVITTSIASFGLSIAVAGDIDVEDPYDLKGKRISWIRGDDALNLGTEAMLAFGDLTWDDVERVEFPGYGRAFEGIIANQSDTAFTVSVAGGPQQLAASPRGITWLTLDPEDKEGWQRLNDVAPYFQPHKVTSGAGISKDDPWIGSSYPYPIVVANADADDTLVNSLVKVFTEDYDKYKDAAPGNAGYALENQNMQWVVPFHDAVVEYYKEIGHWTDEMQAHQDMLVKRQQILLDTWDEYTAGDTPSDEDAFKAGWMEARAAALEEAGMNPVFR
ncbi:TAXI family TRAP transporter solute-binding subunit [Marinobacter bryozoorum]|jgi:TRAP transporter TAXI family solute receptor|uniref:TAXI family TRAP transporter solute-binding subunit n=1 Tax=Marinobacter bryozoorum TaxID=256324 RepID=UPI0020033D04|nr:TAXI family TRAP transporter solute-binding subunit [Marinobacter bryozoorum]MCK7542574.1 TAXI family TRAP transporter solute-binding subunit [Marinobacter bryozoorum]